MLLLWSGGCDSTLILAARLANKEPVRTISISINQFNHNAEQFAARQAIVAHYKKKKIQWPHVEVSIANKYPFDFKSHVQMGGVIPGIWMGLAPAYLDINEDLAVGYIHGDNAIHWLEDIRSAFRSLQAISQRTGQLVLPIEWHSKAMVIHELKTHRLLGKTWWCENPKKGRPCGLCAPCMTHKMGLWQLANKGDFKLHGDWKHAETGVPDDKETPAKEKSS
jgi:7-cyano-7-deazaguanine synthase in queuosine biosynthesis